MILNAPHLHSLISYWQNPLNVLEDLQQWLHPVPLYPCLDGTSFLSSSLRSCVVFAIENLDISPTCPWASYIIIHPITFPLIVISFSFINAIPYVRWLIILFLLFYVSYTVNRDYVSMISSYFIFVLYAKYLGSLNMTCRICLSQITSPETFHIPPTMFRICSSSVHMGILSITVLSTHPYSTCPWSRLTFPFLL